jgi:hypothetical protein
MSTWRKRTITALVIVFVFAHVPYYFTGVQHWPFTTFPMFSWKMSTRENGNAVFECELAYGVPADPSKPEFRLKPPMTGITHANDAVFRRMLRFPYRGETYDRLSKGCPADNVDACASQRMVREALRTVFHRYDKKRGVSKALPPLAGVKLYRVRYEFALDTATFKEAGKTLLGEWTVAGDTP